MEYEKLVEEAFYGKLPEFEEMEKEFTSLIARVEKEGTLKCNPNKFEELRRIEKIFRKLFGFKKACIYIEPYAQPNAYAYSMNVFLIFSDKKAKIEKGDRGFYDTSGTTTLGVFATAGMFDQHLTAKQWIAIILHEIGHNFDFSPYHKIDYLIYNIISFGEAKKEVSEWKNKIDDLRDSRYNDTKKEGDKYYDAPKRRSRADKRYEEAIKKAYKVTPLQILSLPLKMGYRTVTDFLKILCLPYYTIKLLGGKKAELFADSFATAYGYGEDLISALSVLDKYTDKYVDQNSKIARFFNDLHTFQYEFLSSVTDSHGTSMERCKECIEKLEWDLAHNEFPPELKEELKREITSLTKQYKAFHTMDPDEKIRITKIWRIVVVRLFGGRPNLIRFFSRHKV